MPDRLSSARLNSNGGQHLKQPVHDSNLSALPPKSTIKTLCSWHKDDRHIAMDSPSFFLSSPPKKRKQNKRPRRACVVMEDLRASHRRCEGTRTDKRGGRGGVVVIPLLYAGVGVWAGSIGVDSAAIRREMKEERNR